MIKQRTRCLYKLQLPPHPTTSADKKQVSRFLDSPAHLVVSAPLPDSWHSLCAPSSFVKTLKLYCGTTRILNDKGSGCEVQSRLTRSPPFHVNALLDLDADVRAMAQPSPKPPSVYVYGGLADARQKLPPLHSPDAVRAFLEPLLRLDGRVLVPVVRRCVKAMQDGCQSGDPIAAAMEGDLDSALKSVSCDQKSAWLAYLRKECPGVAGVALAELACRAEDLDVVLVPSMHYFMSNLTGLSAGATLPRRCAQVRFDDYVGLAESASASAVRVGSANTVHVTYAGECSLTVASLGAPVRLVVDGEEHDGELVTLVEPVELVKLTKGAAPLQRALRAMQDAEDIMASHTCVDYAQAVRAAKRAAPHMALYVDCIASGAFKPNTEVGKAGLKILSMLKTQLDHIFKPDRAFVAGMESAPGGAPALPPTMRMSSIIDRFTC